VSEPDGSETLFGQRIAEKMIQKECKGDFGNEGDSPDWSQRRKKPTTDDAKIEAEEFLRGLTQPLLGQKHTD